MEYLEIYKMFLKALETQGCDWVIERLSPTGSGAMTCCGGRGAGDQQGSVEEEGARRLNREDWRVSPGKAEAWAVEFLQFLDACAANSERWKAIAIEEMRLSDVNHEEGRAAAYRHAAANFRLSMPKPDSVAPKERSGRRNDQGHAAARSGPNPT